MSAERPLFYLLDGHAIAYRQYFGLPVAGFTTKSGEPTNAVYGFTRTLLELIQVSQPKYLAVAFDKGLSGRDVVFSEYKGTRDKMPDDLVTQMERIYEVVKAFNIPILSVDGYEADDVMGTVVGQIVEQGVDVRIITGDRDILQLLSDNITVQLPKRGAPDIVYDIHAFEEKYSLHPSQLVDLKALMGDSSDNIPGVKGVGEKTATKFLKQYETLENIYEHLDEIKGANHKKLTNDREMAFISQELATIQRDVPITLELQACVAHEFDRDVVAELFRALEFRTFLQRLFQEEDINVDDDITSFSPPTKSEQDLESVIIRDEKALNELVKKLNKADGITFDVETTSVDQMSAELVGIALACDTETGYYIPVGHKPKGANTLFEQEAIDQLPMETVIEALRAPLTNPNIPKYAHNATYDLVVMQRYGIDVAPIGFDTMIAEWLRDPNSKFLGLKNFALQYLGVQMTPIDELIGKGKKQITMDLVAVDDAAPYASADAVLTHRGVDLLHNDLNKQNLHDLYDTLEMPLIPVIADMQRTGVKLDVDFLADMSLRLGSQLSELEQQIYDLSDGYGDFNINSPKQLNDVLFGKLALPTKGLKKTTHGYSTDVVTLEALKDQHDIIKHIIEYRELTKLKGTYVDALPELVNKHTGRLHTSYNQTGTNTGRISSSNPNLQNIPIRTEIGREVRRAFIASEGRVLLAVDYSQIELRVLAHVSQDKTLLEAFAQGLDIHKATAAAVKGIPVDDVTYEERSFAKRVNFGLLYGMGAFRLARDSELTFAEAEAFIKDYFARLPQVEQYIEDTKRQAREADGVKTLFGRIRRFPALMNPRSSRRSQEAELRAAVNMPIQGTAADIMKQAMINLHNELKKSSFEASMILQVHDELVLDVPEDEIDRVKALVVDVMENAYQLDAPLKANAEVGLNWRDMEDA